MTNTMSMPWGMARKHSEDGESRAICVQGIGSTKPFPVLGVDSMVTATNHEGLAVSRRI